MTKRSLAGIAGIVAIATLISKVFGLVRTQAIAATFAVGPVADAYGLAYAIPGFLLVRQGDNNVFTNRDRVSFGFLRMVLFGQLWNSGDKKNHPKQAMHD